MRPEGTSEDPRPVVRRRAGTQPAEAPRTSTLLSRLPDSEQRRAERDVRRSEVLRQRRVKAAPVLKPGLTSMAGPGARRNKLRSASRAPVTSRVGIPGMPTNRVMQSNPRRRYDIALNVPGAEIRLPAVPHVQIGWRLISGVMVAMMLALLYMIFVTSAFKVESLEASGLQRLTVKDLNMAVGLAGESIFAVDPQVVRQRLEAAFPELSSIKLIIGLPHTVALEAVERTPVISWTQDGQEIWLDAEGVSFPPRGEGTDLLRVQAEGLPPGAEQVGVRQDLKMPPELVATTLAIRPYLPEGATLVYQHDRGFGWQDSRGWQVYFGQQIDDLEEKLVMYQTLVDYLTSQGIQPALISVEYLHAPYYRLER